MTMSTIDTGFREIVSGSASVDTINVLTGAISAMQVQNTTVHLYLRAHTPLKVRIGVQWSNNPHEFTGAATYFAAGYTSAAG